LLPSGHEVDEEIYLALRLVPNVEINVLRFAGYAFRIDPGTHTRRSVRREGYWHFYLGDAPSALASIDILECLMQSLEHLAFGRSAFIEYPHSVLNEVVAWKERMTVGE